MSFPPSESANNISLELEPDFEEGDDLEREAPRVTRPPNDAVSFTMKTDDEVTTSHDPEPEHRAETWFKNNKFTRVPIVALNDDVYKVPNQNYVCFSVITPKDYNVIKKGDQDYQGSLIKFRGVFATREEADRHIRKIMKIDKHFDVHLVPAFSWSLVEDDSVQNREYADSAIADIMKDYFRKENVRAGDFRDRILASHYDPDDENTDRGDEATRFWEVANNLPEGTGRRPPPKTNYKSPQRRPAEKSPFLSLYAPVCDDQDRWGAFGASAGGSMTRSPGGDERPSSSLSDLVENLENNPRGTTILSRELPSNETDTGLARFNPK